MQATCRPRPLTLDLPASDTPVIVIDTNVALDGLLFLDPGAQVLFQMLASRQLRWVVLPRMREEFALTLDRPVLQTWTPDREALLARFDNLSECIEKWPEATRWRCSDPDDQMFFDLALALRARWLLSRDKALLRMVKPARLHGLEICTPARWQPPAGRGAGPAAD